MSLTTRPETTEYAPFYAHYIALVPENDILPVLEAQREEWAAMLRGVSEEVGNTRHAPYTWSVKEVVGHVTDAERVFGYRALCFARGDQNALPGFDENDYVRAAGFDAYRLADLAAEFDALRRSHLYLLRGLPPAAWQRHGVASGNPISVRALAYILAGHARHHGNILHKRIVRA